MLYKLQYTEEGITVDNICIGMLAHVDSGKTTLCRSHVV